MGIFDNKVLSDQLLVQKLRWAARIYQRYADKDVLIVYAKSRKGPFDTYQFHAGTENFQHLAGIKFPGGAEAFFERCLDEERILERSEIVPKESIKITSAKIDVLPDAVDLTKAKAYKCGIKDLVTLRNAFNVALGNKRHVMGLDKRSYYLPIPVTVMNRSIYEFCSEASTIYLIMLKYPEDKKYSIVFYEITEDIIEKAGFDENVLEMIDETLVASVSTSEAATTLE